MSKKPYYEADGFKLIKGDSFKELKKIEPKSIDMIFADPPYFLSGDGISCRAFVHSTETILCAKKDIKKAKHKFNYSLMKELNNLI